MVRLYWPWKEGFWPFGAIILIPLVFAFSYLLVLLGVADSIWEFVMLMFVIFIFDTTWGLFKGPPDEEEEESHIRMIKAPSDEE